MFFFQNEISRCSWGTAMLTMMVEKDQVWEKGVDSWEP